MPLPIPVSTVPAVFAYLQATLRTYINDDPNPQDIYLCVGDPGMQDPPDIINLSGVTRTLPHLAMVGDGGFNALEEVYDVDVIVSASMRGVDAEAISSLITSSWSASSRKSAAFPIAIEKPSWIMNCACGAISSLPFEAAWAMNDAADAARPSTMT